ncbi:MAG: hypothetical protein ACT4ON_16555 [Bacteroidota bacterium]
MNQDIKKAVVRALLCVYCFALLKPVMPLIDDVVAHTFYKMQHIATVHYENGKYHVHAELAEHSDHQDKKGTTASAIYETLASHITNEITESTVNAPLLSKIFPPQTPHPGDIFIKNPTPPPKA